MTKFQSRSAAVESLVQDIGRQLSESHYVLLHRAFNNSMMQLEASITM
jgi:hypothetical protein